MKCQWIFLPYAAARVRYALSFLLLALPVTGIAQPFPYNTWYFGCGQTLQFTAGEPAPGIGLPAVPPHNLYSLHSGMAGAAIAAGDAQGNLQFFVQIKSIVQASAALPYVNNAPKVFDRYGQPFPNGNITANYTEGSGNPLVVPHPGNSHQYYLLYVYNAALLYSLVDMSLNNGLGDIVNTQKDIALTGYGTVIGRKITIVNGCQQKLWLMARSITTNAYYAFAFTSQGINTIPVVSTAGTLPLNSYRTINGGYHGGVLSASNDGRHLVAGTGKGIECYDFEPCSGRVKNARMLDTLPILGLCFSPDDSKLYATAMERRLYASNVPGADNFYPLGRVYQYDLQQTNILASRTQVLENPIKVCLSMAGYIDTVSSWLGDIKRGPDDKLYLASNTNPCSILTPAGAIPVLPSTSVTIEQAMHRINQPDAAGMGCQPQYHAVLLAGSPTLATGFMLPQEIKVARTTPPDTLPARSYPVLSCFSDSLSLAADTAGACYHWDDGSSDSSRKVGRSGRYWVRYNQQCNIRTDTFWVRFIALPQIPQLQYSCPEALSITLPQPTGDTTTYSYTLTDGNGLTQTLQSSATAAFNNLQAGSYSLHIAAGGHCDTTLQLQLEAYPAATVTAHPADTTIRYGDAVTLQAGGAQLYVWWPTASLDTATKANPIARPLKPVQLTVLGINAYGCRDSATVNIDIDYTMSDFIPNAFSPNGDGLNDVFRIGGLRYQRLGVFSIFNRYGREVFRTDDSTRGWDGMLNGQPCDAETYYYLVQLHYPDGSLKTHKGDVVLMR